MILCISNKKMQGIHGVEAPSFNLSWNSQPCSELEIICFLWADLVKKRLLNGFNNMWEVLLFRLFWTCRFQSLPTKTLLFYWTCSTMHGEVCTATLRLRWSQLLPCCDTLCEPEPWIWEDIKNRNILFLFCVHLTSQYPALKVFFSVLFVLAIDFMLLLFSVSLERAPQPCGGVWRGVTGR